MSAQIQRYPSDQEFGLGADMLKLLGEPTRLRIAWMLLHGEHSVNDLAEHVGVLPAAASQHLARLRLARVVRTRREGTRVYYEIDDEHVRGLVVAALVHVEHRPRRGRDRPRRASGPRGAT